MKSVIKGWSNASQLRRQLCVNAFWRKPCAASPQFGSALLLAGLAITLVFGGMLAAKLRTLSIQTAVLERKVGPAVVTGRIDSVEDLPEGRRIVLEHEAIPGIPAERTPRTIRINLRSDEPPLFAGQWVQLRAVLSPPPAPAAPGAYDFQREAFFSGLGGVGFAVGKPTSIDGPVSGDFLTEAEQWLAQLRYNVTARVSNGVGGEAGPVSAALMTGEQAAISNSVMTAMRNSGLAHLLAVSGFNFVLIAGMLFFLVRAALALIPPIALRFPIKKWAAVVALIGAAAYFAITGDSIATERAFIMVSIVFLAVLTDRTAISMRTLAWAAILVLLFQPESLLGASFQLSFAAVVALIAVYEGGKNAAFELVAKPDKGQWWRYPLAYLAGIILTTMVASTATAALLVYHFNRFATYGVIANLVAVPLAAIWIMPWSLLAFILMPFGWEKIALVPMGWGVTALDWIAATTSSWPGAVVTLPAMPVGALCVMTLGGLWLCLWQRRWRFWGLPVIAIGIVVAALARPPDILIDEDAKLMAARADGTLLLSSSRAARLHADSWLRREGYSAPGDWPSRGASADGTLSCDSLGCIYRARGQIAALVQSQDALDDDCATAAIVIATVPAGKACTGPAVVIDRFDLWRRGSYAVWLDPGHIDVKSVRRWQGQRPWVLWREPEEDEAE